MKKKVAAYCIVFILSVGILCSCGKTENEKTAIQLSILRDVLSWEGGAVWNTKQGVLFRGMEESSGKNIFQDPFYEKEEGEDILLQYTEKRQLYYIRTFEGRYYELCCMDLDTLAETILYANCSEAERKYDYLGIKDKNGVTFEARQDIEKTVIRQFCRIGDVIYMMDDDTLYEMNQWTKYKRIIDDELDSDTELVFIDSKIYYKNKDKFLVEYDRKTGARTCLSDWMVQKLCYCDGDLLAQRMNGELYRFRGGELVTSMALPGQLAQGDEKYFYSEEENDSKLVIYDADTLQPSNVIEVENSIWGVAEMTGDVLYYLEFEDEDPVLRQAGMTE